MTQDDVGLLLAVVGGAFVLAAWIGKRTGDAARDVWLVLGTGSFLLASGCSAYLA